MEKEEKKFEMQGKVTEYISKKEQMKVLDKEVKALNKDIMNYFNESGSDSLGCETGIARVQIKNNTSWDEEGLIKYCEEHNIKCVKEVTTKTVDPDMLVEVLAENPELGEQIAQFKKTTQSKSLVYKVSKVDASKEAEKIASGFIKRG